MKWAWCTIPQIIPMPERPCIDVDCVAPRARTPRYERLVAPCPRRAVPLWTKSLLARRRTSLTFPAHPPRPPRRACLLDVAEASQVGLDLGLFLRGEPLIGPIAVLDTLTDL